MPSWLICILKWLVSTSAGAKLILLRSFVSGTSKKTTACSIPLLLGFILGALGLAQISLGFEACSLKGLIGPVKLSIIGIGPDQKTCPLIFPLFSSSLGFKEDENKVVWVVLGVLLFSLQAMPEINRHKNAALISAA